MANRYCTAFGVLMSIWVVSFGWRSIILVLFGTSAWAEVERLEQPPLQGFRGEDYICEYSFQDELGQWHQGTDTVAPLPAQQIRAVEPIWYWAQNPAVSCLAKTLTITSLGAAIMGLSIALFGAWNWFATSRFERAMRAHDDRRATEVLSSFTTHAGIEWARMELFPDTIRLRYPGYCAIIYLEDLAVPAKIQPKRDWEMLFSGLVVLGIPMMGLITMLLASGTFNLPFALMTIPGVIWAIRCRHPRHQATFQAEDGQEALFIAATNSELPDLEVFVSKVEEQRLALGADLPQGSTGAEPT